MQNECYGHGGDCPDVANRPAPLDHPAAPKRTADHHFEQAGFKALLA